jgi:hypothetical protein
VRHHVENNGNPFVCRIAARRWLIEAPNHRFQSQLIIFNRLWLSPHIVALRVPRALRALGAQRPCPF